MAIKKIALTFIIKVIYTWMHHWCVIGKCLCCLFSYLFMRKYFYTFPTYTKNDPWCYNELQDLQWIAGVSVSILVLLLQSKLLKRKGAVFSSSKTRMLIYDWCTLLRTKWRFLWFFFTSWEGFFYFYIMINFLHVWLHPAWRLTGSVLLIITWPPD